MHMRLLLQLFKACEALGGCIIFLDELDSLATSRDRCAQVLPGQLASALYICMCLSFLPQGCTLQGAGHSRNQTLQVQG